MQNSDGWNQFIDLLKIAAKKNKLQDVCEFLFTHEEKEQIATRVEITHALLAAEYSQREISDSLGVSIAKITRGSNALKTIDTDLKNFFKKNL